MRPSLAGLTLVAAVTFAACGDTTIDAERSERFIRGVVVEQVGARVAAVTCPEGMKAKNGATFECAVRGTDGSNGNVEVRRTGDDGDFAVDVPFLHVREAEAVMAQRIGKRLMTTVTIACPEIVVADKGERFACTAASGGTSRRVSVRLTDGAGRFSYRLDDTR